MADLLAVKRLTASDLTFFERLFRTQNAGNQKAINLNADVLTGVLYPRLAAFADTQPEGEISFPLTIFGPAAAGPHRLRRKIVKGGAYKNWRLNGEFVYDPPNEPSRYSNLRDGDLAVFGFTGLIAPEAVSLVLLSATAGDDVALHRSLNRLIPGGRKTMVSLTPQQVAAAMSQPSVDPVHPLSALAADPLLDLLLEDAAQGGSVGLSGLHVRRKSRPVSPAELERAKDAATKIGADGESLVDMFLGRTTNAGGTCSHGWVSAVNAVSPFDFTWSSRGGEMGDISQDIDVKSTKGKFETNIHISMAELMYAAQSSRPYIIFRIFEMNENGAQLSVSFDIRMFASEMVSAHNKAFPPGIRADSFALSPHAVGLTWMPPVRVSASEDDR